MNTPIKSPPRPQASPTQRPAPTESAVSNTTRSSVGGLRRGEAERLRSTWHQTDPSEALSADGMFFSQLLVPAVGEQPDQSGFGGSALNLLPPGDGVPTALIDELAERLPVQPDGPFSVTLLMPNLGRVQVNANKRDNQWSVELAFARRGVLSRLRPHQRACESALADALGQDVDLSFHQEREA